MGWMHRSKTLFWLCLGVGAGYFVAMWLGFAISVAYEQIQGCIPFWDGCTTISRAGRKWPAIIWYKSLMLPSAAAGVAFWWLLARQRYRGLAITGVVGSVCLGLYVIALGVDGDVYRWVRRIGTAVFFIATFAAQLRTTWLSRRWLHSAPYTLLPWRLAALCACANILLCLAGGTALALVEDDDWLENALEWPFAILISWWMLSFAWVLRPATGGDSAAAPPTSGERPAP